MIRTLYRGYFQPTLERAFTHEVRETGRQDPFQRRVVIVPSNLLKLHLRRHLATEGVSHLNLRFLTLLDLARELAREQVWKSGKKEQPELGAGLLAAEVASSAVPSSTYHDVKDLKGFPPVLGDAIRDVRDCLLKSEEIRSVASSERIRDFADLLGAYEARLESAGWLDDADLFRMALAVVADHPFLELEAPLLVYGFYDFTSSQRRLLEGALKRSGSVVFAPIGDGPSFAFGEPTLQWLRGMGFEERASESPGDDDGPEELVELRKRLFESSDDTQVPAEGALEFVAAPGRRAEAREVVREVVSAARKGLSLHEVGIVCRSAGEMDGFDQGLQSLLNDAELSPEECLPVYRHGGRSLASSREARSIVLLLDVVRESVTRRSFFNWMHYQGTEDLAVNMESLVRKAGIVGGRGESDWMDRLQRLKKRLANQRELALRENPSADEGHKIDSVQREAENAALARLEELVGIFHLGASRLTDAKNFTSQVTATRQLIREAAPDDHQLSENIDDALNRVAALDETGSKTDLDIFCRLVQQAFSSSSDRVERFQEGLFLGHLLAARGLPFRVLIVPQMSDGIFPRKGRPSPILLDHERKELNQKLLPEGDVGLPLASRASKEERMLFALACGAARERLILSWPRLSASDGKEIVPSPFLLAAANAVEGRVLTVADFRELSRTLTPGIDRPSDGTTGDRPVDARELDRWEVVRAIENGSPGDALFLAQLHPPARDSIRAEQARFSDRSYTSWDGVLDPEAADYVSKSCGDAVMSPSRLEDYAKCPFAWLSKKVYGLAEIDEPEEQMELTPMERGSLIHSILETFIQACLNEGEEFPLKEEKGADFGQRLDEIADAQIEEFKTSSPLANTALFKVEEARIRRDLRAFLAGEFGNPTGRKPVGLEKPFGTRGLDPLEIELASRTLRVSGIIDRVDLSADRATVIDYKTGRRKPLGDGVNGGRSLQLPLYALAVESVIEPGVSVDRSEYFYCSRKGEGKRVAANVDLWEDGANSELAQSLNLITEGMNTGVFLADPRDRSHCEYCDFRSACGRGIDLEKRMEIKKRDRAAVYFALRDEGRDPTKDKKGAK